MFSMKITSITPNLTQLTRLHFVNAFLVREDDGFTLVDTTMGGAADALIAAAVAARTGRSAASRSPTATATTSARSTRSRRSSAAQSRCSCPSSTRASTPARRSSKASSRAAGPPSGRSPTSCSQAGDRVGSLEVVASPGHSPGHVAYLDTRDQALVAGDVYTTYGSAAVSNHFYLRFPFAAMATWDKAEDLESARALRALDPAILAVGHGPALPQPGAAMDRAITRASK